MKHTLTGLVAASLLMVASPVWAGPVSTGWFLDGGIGTNWSSDLGVDFSQQVHHDAGEPGYTNMGTTTPVTPYGHEFSNEGVVVSLDVNKRGLGSLGGTMSAFAPAAGDFEGMVYHVLMDLHTPRIDQYGMFTSARISGPIGFYGLPVVFPTTVYWGLEWRIVVTAGDETQTLRASLSPPGSGTINITGMHDATGMNFGSVCLNRGDGGCSGKGSGSVNPEFSFELGDGAGSSGLGGAASLETWLTFSSSPVTGMPPHQSGIAEPATLPMLFAGLALLGLVVRRRAC